MSPAAFVGDFLQSENPQAEAVLIQPAGSSHPVVVKAAGITTAAYHSSPTSGKGRFTGDLLGSEELMKPSVVNP